MMQPTSVMISSLRTSISIQLIRREKINRYKKMGATTGKARQLSILLTSLDTFYIQQHCVRNSLYVGRTVYRLINLNY